MDVLGCNWMFSPFFFTACASQLLCQWNCASACGDDNDDNDADYFFYCIMLYNFSWYIEEVSIWRTVVPCWGAQLTLNELACLLHPVQPSWALFLTELISYIMLNQLSCFQFQRASFSNSSHISAKHGIVLFRPVPKYLWGEIYDRVLSSPSLFLCSLHGGELASQFGMISSMLPKASFCTSSFLVCLHVPHHQTCLSTS